MPTINIKGTPLQLPDSASSPNWAPSVVEFFKLVADAINSISGPFDIAPQVMNIDAFNNASDQDVTNLLFPPGDVQAATIIYGVFRQTEDTIPSPPSLDAQAVSEAGLLTIVYNEEVGDWSLTRQGVDDALIDFDITPDGQITFTTSPLTGVDHTGRITFRALAVLNT